MPISDLSRVISSAVVPVVIISACGLLALAFYNRLAAIVGRLRTFQRERLHELERVETADAEQARLLLNHLELQTAHVKYRAKLIRMTLLCLLLTIGLLIGTCLALSLSVELPSSMYVAIFFFILGLLVMLCGIIFAALELRWALEPVEMESQFVTSVLQESGRQDADAA